MKCFRAGVDIGGTFTDIVLLGDEGERYTKKVSSTVDDYARAITEGLAELLAEIGGEARGIAELLHGTTVASNAILEHKGAKTGLITTKGFRDVLEIRNLRMPRLYDMSWTKAPPLVERRLRVEVDERVNAQGGIDRRLDEASVERAARFLLGEGVEAIAVCLLHSYLNPAHEERVKNIVGRLAPGVTLCISAEVLPVINEYERSSTTVINAYVRPIVETYLGRLIGEVKRIGIDAPLLLMQSNGGLTTAKAAAVTPMHIIESGPAAGPVCYDQGGDAPTVTDANVVLGYLNPAQLVGGALKLNAEKARAVIGETIARPLGMNVEEAAYGAHPIAASNMIRALKAVSSERGRDPREYALVAFGGNGPVFAAGMAEAMHIPQVLIPPSAGVFSSFGLLYAEVEYYFTRTRKRLLRSIEPGEIQG